MRLGLLQELRVTLIGFGKFFLFGFIGAEAHRLLANSLGNNLFQSNECAAADKEDVRGVNRSELLVWVLASALRRNVGDGTFQDLQQGLLYAFTADVTGDGWVFVLAANLIDFVDIDDAGLSAGYIAIRGLQTIAKGTSSMRASVCASSVLPVPVGPISRMLDLANSTSLPLLRFM